MGSTLEYFKFFRFRTSVNIAGVHTLTKAIALIDFSMDDLLRESIFINQVIPGCFSYNDLRFMDFSEYEKVLQIAKEINDKRK